jgi:hypothetical protein
LFFFTLILNAGLIHASAQGFFDPVPQFRVVSVEENYEK